MVFDPITGTEITSGKPVTTTTQTKIKDNFDDHEARIENLENGSSIVYPAWTLRVNGPYSIEGAQTKILKTTINFNLRVLGVRLLIDQAGSSGITQIDLQYKRGAGSYTSIFTTKPSVDYSAGNDSISTDGVIDTDEDELQAGDIIALDLTSVQVDGRGFTVRIDYERV